MLLDCLWNSDAFVNLHCPLTKFIIGNLPMAKMFSNNLALNLDPIGSSTCSMMKSSDLPVFNPIGSNLIS